jgi:hypothetical protein
VATAREREPCRERQVVAALIAGDDTRAMAERLARFSGT